MAFVRGAVALLRRVVPGRSGRRSTLPEVKALRSARQRNEAAIRIARRRQPTGNMVEDLVTGSGGTRR